MESIIESKEKNESYCKSNIFKCIKCLGLKEEMKNETFYIKSSIRKKKLNKYLFSKRKINSLKIENKDKKEMEKYITNEEDLNLSPEFTIKDIPKYYSNVILIKNIFNF